MDAIKLKLFQIEDSFVCYCTPLSEELELLEQNKIYMCDCGRSTWVCLPENATPPDVKILPDTRYLPLF